MKGAVCLFCMATLNIVLCAPGSSWKHRNVYQVITDRFARTQPEYPNLLDSNTLTCMGSDKLCPWGGYCGGTFKGVIGQLPRIKALGFDSIWISPIVENYPCSYHGYHATDFYRINPYFGTDKDLKELSKAVHALDMYLMVDVVYNHIGPVPCNETGYSQIAAPFNNPEWYHDPNCPLDPLNQTSLEVCMLGTMCDIKQEGEDGNLGEAGKELIRWSKRMIHKYKIDGFRIDTVPYVHETFYPELQKNIPDTFTIGEILIRDKTVDYNKKYVREGLSSTLNYPLFDALRSAFDVDGDMNNLAAVVANIERVMGKEHSLTLGNFADNHDQTRIFYNRSAHNAQNAIVFALTWQGIPILYYGSEYGMRGGYSDNEKRQPLWRHTTSKADYNYQLIKQTMWARKEADSLETTVAYHDRNWLAFFRGTNKLVLVSNSQQREYFSAFIHIPFNCPTGRVRVIDEFSELHGNEIDRVTFDLAAGDVFNLTVPGIMSPFIFNVACCADC